MKILQLVHDDVRYLKKNPRMRSLNFWDTVASDYYDVYVLGQNAPIEIREFIEEEDKKLYHCLDSLIKDKEEFIFLEVGSGTGRFIVSLMEKILKDKYYDKYLKMIIGIDFSIAMIKSTIDKLLMKTPRFLQIEGSSEQITSESLWLKNRLKKQVRDEIVSRILLICADATKPILHISGIKVVVAVTFGTLGNIISGSARKELIRQVHQIADDITLFSTGFKRSHYEIGYRRYAELGDKGFLPLKNVEWNDQEFTSSQHLPDGQTLYFYSHWFDEKEFEELFSSSFGSSNVSVESLLKHGLIGLARKNKRSNLRCFFGRQEEISINILCPCCGSLIMSIPLATRGRYEHCGVRHYVEEYRGLSFPVVL